ncbi:non-structural protein [Ceratitis capitata negev-like virus 2]|nr:non-structural protein [Ceratitis capitata negev-like virus 2]
MFIQKNYYLLLFIQILLQGIKTSQQTAIAVPPRPHPRRLNTKTGIESRVSEADKRQYYDFCCQCVVVTANCPICKRNGVMVCPNDLTTSQANAMALKAVPLYYSYLEYEATPVAIGHEPFFIWNKSTYKLDIIPTTTCRPTQAEIKLGVFSEMERCTVVIPQNSNCPRSDVILVNECGWSFTNEVLLDNDYKACIAPVIYSIPVTLTSDNTAFCNHFNTIVNTELMPQIGPFITKLETPSRDLLPKSLGRVGDKWFFKTVSVSAFYQFTKKFSAKPYTSDFGKPTRQTFMVVSNPNAVIDSEVFNGYPSYLIDRIVMKTDCTPTSFTEKHTFCGEAMSTSAGYIAPPLTTESHDYQFFVYIDNVEVPEMNISLPCSKLNRMGRCTLNTVLDELQQNFTRSLNDSMQLAVTLMTDIMGANDTSLLTFSTGDTTPRTLGNWFSGIFASLIEPFFEAFINIVLKAFLPPLIEAFIAVLDVISNLVSQFANSLLNILSDFGSALGDLLTVFLNLLVGILCFVETHILLFEYTILFLFIMWRWVDDWVFASIIIVILMITFGIKRKSPSFIMYFVSNDFVFFDFSSYYKQTFDWAYSLSYTINDTRYIFFFINSTTHAIQLY